MTVDEHSAATATGSCPHVGAEFMPLAGNQLTDPYPIYTRARREQPVFYSPLFGMWFVSRYDDIKDVLLDPETFSSKDITVKHHSEMAPEVQRVFHGDYRDTQHLLSTDHPTHTRLRALLRHGFKPQRIAALQPRVHEIADALIDSFITQGRVDLIDRFAYPLPLTVILEVFGVPQDDIDRCRRWSEDLFHWILARPLPPVDQQVTLAHGVAAFQRYTEHLVQARRQQHRDDMISHLLQAHEDGIGELTNNELVDNIQGFIIAGHETTANLLGNAIKLLLTHPPLWHAIGNDDPLIEKVVEEALRMDSPVLGMPRTTTQKTELGGVTLPAGSTVFLLFGSANHDPEHFDHPDTFDITRPNNVPHLSFGRGIHTCIGATVARLEARVAISRLRTRLPDLTLEPHQPFRYQPKLAVRGLTHLWATWKLP